MRFRNRAPYALEVPSLGVGTIVEPGEVIDVTDRKVAEGMTGQAVWQKVAPEKPKTDEKKEG